MAPVPFEAFVRACREADAGRFAGFVAALYEARGWTVERVDDRHLTLGWNGHSRRVVLAEDEPPDAPDAATVVVTATDVDPAGTPDGVRTLDLVDLHRQCCYAVDVGTGARLAAAHLDVPVEPRGTDGRESGANEGGQDDGERPPDGASAVRHTIRSVRRHALVPLVVGVVALAVVAGLYAVTQGAEDLGVAPEDALGTEGTGVGPAGTDAPTPTAPSGRETPRAQPADDGSTVEDRLELYAAESQARGIERGDALSFPTRSVGDGERVPASRPPTNASLDLVPGITYDGTIDERVLARRHRSAVANTSYTLTVTYTEVVGGHVTGRYTEVVRVAGDGRFTASVDSLGSHRSTVPTVVGEEGYYNGSLLVTRENGTRSGFATGTVRAKTEAFLRRYTSVEESMVVDWQSDDGGHTYWVVTEGNSAPRIRNSTGAVYVTERGVVTYGRWSYDIPGSVDGRAVFALQTANVGETSVAPPGWVDTGT